VAQGQLIAVIDEDLARRVAVVEAISAHGYEAFGVSEMEHLHEDDRSPALILFRALGQAHLEEGVGATGDSPRLGEAPLIVVGSCDGDVRAVDAFAAGAVDFVTEDVEEGELCARIEVRLRDHHGQSTACRRPETEQPVSSHRRFVDYFESSADGIIVMTRKGNVLSCNPSACQICGVDEVKLAGTHFAELLSRDGRARFEEVQSSLARAVYPRNVDLAVRTSLGDRRILNVSFSSVRQEPDSVMVSLRDVTEGRTMARELTKTKEFLERVIDSSVDAIVSADMDGKVLLFNPAAERTYGYAASDVVGKMNVRKLYPRGTAEDLMRRIRSDELGGPGVIHGFETELLGEGGARIPVMLSASLIHHRGQPIGSVGVFKDMRTERNISRRLVATQRELEVQEKKAFVAELAGAAAHELNQPLTAVMGYADMLARTLDDDSRLKRATNQIVTETERMAEIVRKIGKLTRYESKAYVGDTKIIDIERSMDTEPPATGR